MNQSLEPRRTSTKELTDKKEKVSKKDKKEKIEQKQAQEKQEQYSYNVMEILAQYYPQRGEDYAIQLFYRSKENRHNPFFKCTEKRMDNVKYDEIAHLVINGFKYQVNIRTGEINSVIE